MGLVNRPLFLLTSGSEAKLVPWFSTDSFHFKDIMNSGVDWKKE